MKRRKVDQPAGPDNKAGDYEVGYGKPPKASQFQKGQSGNPRGRPRGARNRPSFSDQYDKLSRAIMKVVNGTMVVRDGDKVVSMTGVEAILQRMRFDALKGKGPAQRYLLDSFGELEAMKRKERQTAVEHWMSHKLEWEFKLEQCRQQGLPEPDVLPHPDHLIVDPWSGAVSLIGPMTPEERAEEQLFRKFKANHQREIQRLEEELRESPDDPKILAEIQRYQEMIAKIDECLSFERVISPPIG